MGAETMQGDGMLASLALEISARARKRRESIAALLGELIRIPSPSGREEAVIARIRGEMAAIGFDDVRTDALGSVIGRIGEGPAVIAMDAHVDTVAPGNPELWHFDPFSGEIRAGRVWGRGASDQKGGMAALLHAAGILVELRGQSREAAEMLKRCTLLFTGTVMEEDCDGLCWQHLIREDGVKPDVCVITEPTGCRIYHGQRGRMEIRVEVAGRSAHGSAPERGANAIYHVAELVRAIERYNAALPTDEFLGKGSITVTEILSSGPSLCAVPDFAAIHIDRRLTWGETRESALSGLAEIISQCSWAKGEWAGDPDRDSTGGPAGRTSSMAGKAFRMLVPTYAQPAYTQKVYPSETFFPAWRMAEDHRAVAAAHHTYRALWGEAPAAGSHWTFSTNGVAICGIFGIPCVGFGPGEEREAHAPDESCAIDDLERAAAFYAAYPFAYCSDSQ